MKNQLHLLPVKKSAHIFSLCPELESELQLELESESQSELISTFSHFTLLLSAFLLCSLSSLFRFL